MGCIIQKTVVTQYIAYLCMRTEPRFKKDAFEKLIWFLILDKYYSFFWKYVQNKDNVGQETFLILLLLAGNI